MECRRHVAIVMTLCLLGQAFSVPINGVRWRRGLNDNELGSKESDAPSSSTMVTSSESPTRTSSFSPVSFKDSDSDSDSWEDDDDEFESMQPAPSGGSNIFSLLRLATALFPSSGGTTPFIRRVIREILAYNYNQGNIVLRRQDVRDNEIEIDYVQGLKPPPPPFQRQESDEEESDSSESDSEGDESNGAQESLEDDDNNGGENDADDASTSNDDDDDFDSDEPPEGDGQGGGILGILAGLSGGEDGQSDLGDLLATVSGIVVNLSGDGIDVNAIIASALGLFVGLLSEGEENPGAIIASYLLTSLESITGGGAKNNGAFFGNFVSKLVKGTSAAGDPEEGSEEEGNGMKMADSAGFFASLLMSLLGEMSKTSSGGSSHPWRRYEQAQQLMKFERNYTES